MGLTILTNDLIWWVPFSLILLNAKHQEFADATGVEESPGLPPNTLLRRDSAQRSKIVYSSLQGAVSDK
jgi:hypothetical protein